MPFIDRFVKVPIQVYHQTEAEVTGKKRYEDSYAYILPSEIDEIFPSSRAEDDMEDGPPITQVYVKSGRAYTVELQVDRFIDLLNRHYNP